MEPVTTNRSIYLNISPLDHRYLKSNPALFNDLASYLSEEANVRYLVKAEIALIKAHLKQEGRLDAKTAAMVDSLEQSVDPAEVYAEEDITQHNIRALVNVIKRKLPDDLAPLVHLGSTSVDIMDSAQAARIRDAVRRVILPVLLTLLERLADLAEKEADTPQVGRTHGQHAVPITVGFALAEYIARLGKSIEKIEAASLDLRGKLAGAVGAYNATSLLVKDPYALEADYLAQLGLAPSEHSTQLVEPEHLLRLFLEMNVAFGVIANLADDLRHLQRSEISELREFFTSTQVGSSTMPQKRNPWNSEHVKSLWKAFAPRVMTFFMDQISEHQRDLSNSASGRFAVEYLAGFGAAVARMDKVVASLNIDRERCAKNLSQGGDFVLAEAAYILLARTGESDAHEVIRLATLACEKEGTLLAVELKKSPKVWNAIDARLRELAGTSADEFFHNPGLYRGRAPQKARELSARYKALAKTIKERLA